MKVTGSTPVTPTNYGPTVWPSGGPGHPTTRPPDHKTKKKRFRGSISTIFDNGRREKFECELISSSISRQSNRARGFEAKPLVLLRAGNGEGRAADGDLKKRTSAKGRTVDALASQGDEGRGKLR